MSVIGLTNFPGHDNAEEESKKGHNPMMINIIFSNLFTFLCAFVAYAEEISQYSAMKGINRELFLFLGFMAVFFLIAYFYKK